MKKRNSKSNSSLRLKQANKTTIIGAVLNIVLSLTKITAGVIGHSQAMIADGIHSLSDLGSDLAVLIGMLLASRPEDSTHNYGHGKYETLSALIIGIILITVGVGIGYSSIITVNSIIQGNQIVQPQLIAFIAAIISIIIKEFLFRYTIKKGRDLDSSAVIANAYHHRSDAYSSLAAALGIGGAILLGNKWVILDPIAGMIVSVLIIKEAFYISKSSLDELLETALPIDLQDKILKISESVPGVYKPHNLQTRKIGNVTAIDLHLYIKADQTIANGHYLSHKVEEEIKKELGTSMFINVHIEPWIE